MESALFKKVYGCLCGGLIGDAMGAPSEGMNYDEIAVKFGWIEEFQGAGTDDSAIKQILCQAIIENEGHVTADEWAKAFLANKEKYYPLFYIPVRNMFHKIESGLSLPVYAGMGNMHSSSSAMSISPMGIINACDPRQAALETYDAAGLIHAGDSTFCRDGACAIAAAVAEALKPGSGVEDIIAASVKYLHPKSSAELLAAMEKTMEIARRAGGYEAFRIEFYEKCLGDIVSDSRETVPCTMALFLLADGDFVKCVTYAANFGRDSDTIGTMIGAIAGAHTGIDGFPVEWISKLEDGYGKNINVSKDYELKSVELMDQRELADKLIGVIHSRRSEREAALALLASLE